MGRRRQKDHRTYLLRHQKVISKIAFCNSVRRRSTLADWAFRQPKTTFSLAMKSSHALNDYHYSMMRIKRISELDFSFNFNAFTKLDCLHHFRFEKAHIGHLVSVMGWPETTLRTERNRYRVNPILATCIVLRRLATPSRWKDLEEYLGNMARSFQKCFGRL